MTRPAFVRLELPIEEAEGLLKRVAPDGSVPSMTAAECDAAEQGRLKIEQAVRVERGASGSAERKPTLKEQAEELLGRQVVVYSTEGRRFGELRYLRESCSIVVVRNGLSSSLPIEVVTSIREEEPDGART